MARDFLDLEDAGARPRRVVGGGQNLRIDGGVLAPVAGFGS